MAQNGLDTDNIRIPMIINRNDCEKHKVPLGVPCFHIRTLANTVLPAICNHRAREAGFTSSISSSSLGVSRHGK